MCRNVCLGESLLIPTKIYVKSVLHLLEKVQVFNLIQKVGNIPERDMYNTFNMGIGMAVIVNSKDVQKAIKILKQEEDAYIIGEVTKGNGDVEII